MAAAALNVLDAVKRSCVLDGLLGVEPHDADKADRDAVALSLIVHFSQLKRDGGFLSRVCRALDALVVLVRVSHSLGGYPLAKRAFWRRALEHPACRSLLVNARELAHTHALRYEDPHFPRLVLDCSHSAFTAELARAIADWQCADEPDSEWLDLIHVHLPVTHSLHVEPVTLRLQRCRLTVGDIKRLEVVLRPRLPATEDGDVSMDESDPSFRIAALDLTDNPLGEAHMNALARVIRTADQPLDALVLENVMVLMASPRVMTAFRALVRAAAGLAPGHRGGVRCLSLARNSLTIDYFAAVCSAVQDPASSIEELCLARTLSINSPNDRFYCWWWLAMGLSRRVDPHGLDRGTDRLRRVDLSGNPLFPRDIEVWSSTLQSPLAVLSRESVQPPDSRVYRLPAHGCRVFSSPVDNLESAEHIAEVADMFSALPAGSEVSLEAMGVDNEGWVCLLVPGYGLVWAPPTLAAAQHPTAEGGSATEQRQPTVRELVVGDLVSVDTTVVSLCAFIESVGASLESLSIKRTVGFREYDLGMILARCPNLERLDLEGTRFFSWEPLIRALEGPLGQTLRSLNLRCNRFGYLSAGLLASALVEREPLPALEELRLGQTHIGIPGAESMERVLHANKRLRILELPMPNLQASDDEYAELCSSLERSFQGELLAVTPMPMRCKLAFLSVLHARDDIASLDAGVLHVIFELAAVERRRRLVWWRWS